MKNLLNVLYIKYLPFKRKGFVQIRRIKMINMRSWEYPADTAPCSKKKDEKEAERDEDGGDLSSYVFMDYFL